MRAFIFLIVIATASCLSAARTECPSSYVETKVWEKVYPYLMQENHPIKETLDSIVSSKATSVFANMETMCEAGFERVIPQPYTKLIVTRHSQLKGYIIKAYLDDQDYYHDKPEHYFWVKRVKGANLIREAIKNHGYSHLLKVPKKWIYLLPDKPSFQGSSENLRKMFILVEEEMDILNDTENKKKWASPSVTEELLQALYTIITEYRFKDCAKPANCPFCEDGKVAFVDTQSFYKKRISYYKLTPYLSSSMKSYWVNLCGNRNMPWFVVSAQLSAIQGFSKFHKVLSRS